MAADDYTILETAPRFDIDALSVDGFTDEHSTDGWLPEDLPLEWTRTCCWRNTPVSMGN